MSTEAIPRGSGTLTDERAEDSDRIPRGTPFRNERDIAGNPSQRKDEVVEVEAPSAPFLSESTKEKRESQYESGSEEENVEIAFSETKETPLEDNSVKLDIKTDDEGEDTPTLPLNKKKNKKGLDESKLKSTKKEKPPMYIFPITRLKLAWTGSSNVVEFVFRAIAIVFSTLGWLFCVGGVPLMSLAMLIIGSIYIDDCNIEPNIPVYLIVSGVFGTLQHFIAVWTKYIPKESQGRMKVYRAYCRVVDYIIHLFLAIWFILGCVWVYGVNSEVVFRDPYKDEYCNKTLYYFAFWILNISFILLALLIVGTFCCIIFIVIAPKSEDQSNVT